MEIDAKKIKALCNLDDAEFAKILENVAISAGSDAKTVKNIVKNAPSIKKMLAGASEAELAMVTSLLQKKGGRR
jgi:hypothetical protein